MTIAGWNVFLNAAIIALMVLYGFWLKHITVQQDRLKGNTVEALGAVIASKEAEIARLKGESAPELAKHYKALKDYSEEMSRKANELERDLEKLRSDLGEREALLSANYLGGESSGLISASILLIKLQESLKGKLASEEALSLWRSVNDLTGELLHMAQGVVVRAKSQLKAGD